MKKIVTSTLLVLALFGVKTYAQDIHYSQFYASPLTLNPGLTGVFEGNYRIGAMYRNQWSSVTSNPYVTPSVSFDWNGIAPKAIKKGVVSAGILILDDKSGLGNLNNLSIIASGAYRFFIGNGRKNNLSLGLQAGYVQKSIDLTNLTFENEFDGTGFNQNLGTGETDLSKAKTSYVDVNAGAVFTSKLSKMTDFYAGVAGFNLNNPKETFFGDGSNKLPIRIVAHGGFRFGLTSTISLLPAVLYMTQDGAQEVNVGTSLSFLFKGANSNDVTLYIGGYVRLQDAIIAMVGVEYKNVRVGLSYDINTSTLQTASHNNGGFEISLNYIGLLNTLINEPPVLFCPRY